MMVRSAARGPRVRLEDLRRRRAWSQAELAVAAGVSPKTVWLLENGRRDKVQGRIIRSLAKVLGVQPEDIDEFRASLGLEPPAAP